MEMNGIKIMVRGIPYIEWKWERETGRHTHAECERNEKRERQVERER